MILTKCIDLSVAANLALTGMVAAMLNGMPACRWPLILLAAIAAWRGSGRGQRPAGLEGSSIPPIVVTLGTMTIYRGTIFLLSDGKWVNAHEMSRRASRPCRARSSSACR